MQTMPDLLMDGPETARHTLILAHGAGGAMDTPFMSRFARELAARAIRVVRFEFPYMAARRTGKKRGAPDRPPVLIAAWKEVVAQVGGPVFIGGKSMGGRIASMVADDVGARGLICLGYPFHPPGNPARLRTEHLATLGTPTLIIQGERDPFGTREEVAGYQLSKTIRIEWLPDGDHSFKPRAASGRSEAQNLNDAIELAARFVAGSGH
jgi:predicted alpha/beta-hydrolase family hydrolase